MLLLLGDQLFPLESLKKIKFDIIFMAEDQNLASRYKFHKQKIVFFFSSMREQADLLKKKYPVDYWKLEKKSLALSYEDKLKATVKKHNISQIVCFEIEDSFIESRIKNFCDKNKLDLEIVPSPMFLTTREEFKKYLTKAKKPFMKVFYEQQRKEKKILVTKDLKPVGGQWSFDKDNRSKIPKNHIVQKTVFPATSKVTKDVEKTVEEFFSNHPGETGPLWLPTTRVGALKWFESFLEERFINFGLYEDALSDQTPLLYHSGISSLLNTGLLLPQEVINRTLSFAKENSVPMNNTEGFIRQIMGWREFVRGMYHHFNDEMENKNFWNHKNKLSKHWYDGTTGIIPLDDCIKKVIKYGYLHHIERLMVVSNIMLLSEIHPKEVYQWFMELFIDSGDWVMAANVYGMGQMSEGGLFATKPYICGSNYLLKMSNYQKDTDKKDTVNKNTWCDVVDGLYWSFIDNNKEFFKKNPRLSMMVKLLDKMDSKKKNDIFAKAKKFRHNQTINI